MWLSLIQAPATGMRVGNLVEVQKMIDHCESWKERHLSVKLIVACDTTWMNSAKVGHVPSFASPGASLKEENKEDVEASLVKKPRDLDAFKNSPRMHHVHTGSVWFLVLRHQTCLVCLQSFLGLWKSNPHARNIHGLARVNGLHEDAAGVV